MMSASELLAFETHIATAGRRARLSSAPRPHLNSRPRTKSDVAFVPGDLGSVLRFDKDEPALALVGAEAVVPLSVSRAREVAREREVVLKGMEWELEVRAEAEARARAKARARARRAEEEARARAEDHATDAARSKAREEEEEEEGDGDEDGDEDEEDGEETASVGSWRLVASTDPSALSSASTSASTSTSRTNSRPNSIPSTSTSRTSSTPSTSNPCSHTQPTPKQRESQLGGNRHTQFSRELPLLRYPRSLEKLRAEASKSGSGSGASRRDAIYEPESAPRAREEGSIAFPPLPSLPPTQQRQTERQREDRRSELFDNDLDTLDLTDTDDPFVQLIIRFGHLLPSPPTDRMEALQLLASSSISARLSPAQTQEMLGLLAASFENVLASVLRTRDGRGPGTWVRPAPAAERVWVPSDAPDQADQEQDDGEEGEEDDVDEYYQTATEAEHSDYHDGHDEEGPRDVQDAPDGEHNEGGGRGYAYPGTLRRVDSFRSLGEISLCSVHGRTPTPALAPSQRDERGRPPTPGPPRRDGPGTEAYARPSTPHPHPRPLGGVFSSHSDSDTDSDTDTEVETTPKARGRAKSEPESSAPTNIRPGASSAKKAKPATKVKGKTKDKGMATDKTDKTDKKRETGTKRDKRTKTIRPKLSMASIASAASAGKRVRQIRTWLASARYPLPYTQAEEDDREEEGPAVSASEGLALLQAFIEREERRREERRMEAEAAQRAVEVRERERERRRARAKAPGKGKAKAKVVGKGKKELGKAEKKKTEERQTEDEGKNGKTGKKGKDWFAFLDRPKGGPSKPTPKPTPKAKTLSDAEPDGLYARTKDRLRRRHKPQEDIPPTPTSSTSASTSAVASSTTAPGARVSRSEQRKIDAAQWRTDRNWEDPDDRLAYLRPYPGAGLMRPPELSSSSESEVDEETGSEAESGRVPFWRFGRKF